MQVNSHFVEKHGLAVVPAARTVALADGNTVKVIGVCKARLRIGNITDVHTFLVLSLDSAYDVLLGQDWLRRRGAVLDFGTRTMTVSHRNMPVSLPAAELGSSSSGGEDSSANDDRTIARQLAVEPAG